MLLSDRRLTADLSFVSLPDLLQLLAGIRASGLIIVRSGEKSGVINLRDGAIVDAHATRSCSKPRADDDTLLRVAGNETSAAIWRMAEWSEGELVFDPGWTPQQTPRLSVGEVLMEGLGFA